MCGIAGIFRMGEKRITKQECDAMLQSLEYRGNDATGIAIAAPDGTVHVLKQDTPAWRFTALPEYNSFIEEHLNAETQIVLLHTRKATVGNPHVNNNNHPLFAGKSAVVHNGSVHNHDYLFNELGLKREADTDSDAIRAIIDKFGITRKAIKELNRISGAVAAAAVHPEFPGHVLLLRSSNPLVIADTKHKIYWASDKRTIYRACKPWTVRHGMIMQLSCPQLSWCNLVENSGWIINVEKGLIAHEEFQANGTPNRGYLQYNVHGVDYHARKAGFVREAERTAPQAGPRDSLLPASELLPHLVYCPNPTCRSKKGGPTVIRIMPDARKLPLHRLGCKKCETNLAKAQVCTLRLN